MVRQEIGFDTDKKIYDRFPEKRHFGNFNNSEVGNQGLLKGQKNNQTHVEIFDYPRTLWVKDIVGASSLPSKKLIKDKSLEPNKPEKPRVNPLNKFNSKIHLREKYYSHQGEGPNYTQFYESPNNYGPRGTEPVQRSMITMEGYNREVGVDMGRPSWNDNAKLRGGRLPDEIEHCIDIRSNKSSYARSHDVSPQKIFENIQANEQNQPYRNNSHIQQSTVNFNRAQSFERVPRDLQQVKSAQRFAQYESNEVHGPSSYQSNNNFDSSNGRISPDVRDQQRSNSFFKTRDNSQEKNQRKQIVIYNIISNQPAMRVSASPSRYEIGLNE